MEIDIVKEIRTVLELINAKSTDQVRAEADEGNPDSAIDYALRCVTIIYLFPIYPTTILNFIPHYAFRYSRVQFGFKCIPSRQLSRVYRDLLKVLSSPNATSVHQSMAHALLIEWFSRASEPLRKRYLHAAAHHATEAVKLAGGEACPAVLYFAARILEPHS